MLNTLSFHINTPLLEASEDRLSQPLYNIAHLSVDSKGKQVPVVFHDPIHQKCSLAGKHDWTPILKGKKRCRLLRLWRQGQDSPSILASDLACVDRDSVCQSKEQSLTDTFYFIKWLCSARLRHTLANPVTWRAEAGDHNFEASLGNLARGVPGGRALACCVWAPWVPSPVLQNQINQKPLWW